MADSKNKIIDPEYGVDSRYASQEERDTEAMVLMEARLERMKNVSKEQIKSAKLMQLKFKMEEFIKQTVLNRAESFNHFLKSYISILYSKQSLFADDIGITSAYLSQIINNHRQPKEDFLKRLMLHSEKVYAEVCDFNKRIWYQVYQHERLCDTMSRQSEWRAKFEKQIKYKKMSK